MGRRRDCGNSSFLLCGTVIRICWRWWRRRGGGADGGADLLVTGELAYAGPIVAEKTGVPWASYVLAPFSFFSGYDPPVLPPYPMLAKVQERVPALGHVVARFARFVTRKWPEPVYELRRELG